MSPGWLRCHWLRDAEELRHVGSGEEAERLGEWIDTDSWPRGQEAASESS